MAECGRRFRIGDVLPDLHVLNGEGKPYSLRDQRIAGDPIALVCDGPRHPARQPAEREAAAIADAGGHVLRIRCVAPDPAATAGTYFDPQRMLPGLFGFDAPAIVALSPAFRLEAVLPDGAFAEAAALAGTHAAAPVQVLGPGMAPALIVPDVLEPPLIDRLIAYWHGGDKLKDGVSHGKGATNVSVRSDFKRRADVLIAEQALFLAVKDRILTRVAPMMQRAFGFEVASMEALRIGCYDAADAGFFRRHRDNATKFTAQRKFAMSLNLNTGAYEGGRLTFPEFGRTAYDAPAGGAVVFSCSLLHEAGVVTSGRRFAVFTFFTDSEGARRQAEMQRTQQMDPKGGVRIR